AGRPVTAGVALSPGTSVFVPAGETNHLTGTGTVFRATVVTEHGPVSRRSQEHPADKHPTYVLRDTRID
ncbi:hypothetical protein ACFY8F_40540, partial [Streptomyces tanashiensis]